MGKSHSQTYVVRDTNGIGWKKFQLPYDHRFECSGTGNWSHRSHSLVTHLACKPALEILKSLNKKGILLNKVTAGFLVSKDFSSNIWNMAA